MVFLRYEVKPSSIAATSFSTNAVKKEIHQELTYRDLDSTIDNLWSILFTTGYLTQRGEDESGLTELDMK